MADSVLIIGATGQISRGIIPHLNKSGTRTRVLVRNRQKAASMFEQGVEIVEADLERPRTLPAAFDGIDVVWNLTAVTPRSPEQSSNAVWAARQAGVRRIVRLSSTGAAHDAPAINSRLLALSDAEILSSGISYTLLRPHFFMQNLLMAAQSVATDGNIYLALADAKLPMIDVRDISEAAARVLTTPGHENKIYTLTGPRVITVDDVAKALGNVLEKPVNYIPIPLQAADEALEQIGFDEWIRTVLGDYFALYSQNWYADVTDDFEKIVGRPARGIETFLRDYGSAFAGQPTPEVAAALASLRP